MRLDHRNVTADPKFEVARVQALCIRRPQELIMTSRKSVAIAFLAAVASFF